MPDFQPKFESLVQVFNRSMEKFSERALFGVKRDDQWHWMTYGEWGDRVRRLHTALQKLGVGAGDRVAIISNNNPEWAMGAYASYGLGAAHYRPLFFWLPACFCTASGLESYYFMAAFFFC